ncbi:MAG: alkaline shock response membrane anchor protein AmaP [Candidatus Hydromicrobium sp.]|nr:alkaline shock response membrane anchor protein AmaP [Actinomycetota bacterium]MDP3011383.1 alkaline shock response membrane anchor protein AmaP [Candidatus Hydromicrobium sp.]
MNIFNRIIMVILMLVLIVFSIIAILNIFMNLFEWSTISDRVTSYTANLNPYILAAILFLVLVIALIILIFEFYRRKIKLANISTDQSGKTMVTLKTSAKQIRENLNNIQGVIDPQVKVVPRQNGIIIDIFSKLITGISVVDKTKEIRETASNFASKNLGFKVLQTNYTATGFVTKKVKEAKVIKEEELKEIKQEEQVENKIE